jgi:hypothetical protein
MTLSMGDSPEFNPDWDVYRDLQGKAVTITEEQLDAIWHAIAVVGRVRATEKYQSLWSKPRPNLYKSRLLGRMLLDGKPPTRTKPPINLGGPAWSLLPGGDPFADLVDDAESPSEPGKFRGTWTRAFRQIGRRGRPFQPG